jgi:hypothetical protein
MIGAAYRWSAAMVVLSISDGMYIGYAYDLGDTNLDNYTLDHTKFSFVTKYSKQ